MKNILILIATTSLAVPLFGQFPNIDWQYNTNAPAFGSAAAADMDNDGFYEIVFTTYTNDGRAHCLNAEDGSVKWIYNIGGCGDVAPLIYDMDNDDTLDVVINGSCNPTIFCINGCTGQLIWSMPSGGGDSPPTVANLDTDTFPEVLFCNFNGELRIYNGEDGTTNANIQVDNGPIQTEPTLVDVNGDSRLDIILANHYNTNGYYIWAYDYVTQDTIWTNYLSDTSSTYNAYHGGAVADLDNDGNMEYVIGANNGMVRALNVEDGSLFWSVTIPQSCMSPVSIADLDGDSTLEVVVTNNDWITFDERIWVLDALDGSTEWSYPTTFSSFRGCAIADINGNGTLDLVAGYYMGDVIAVEPYSGLIWQHNLLQYFPPGLPYFMVDHGPLVADFDQNGSMDVFIVAGYGTYTPDSQNCGKAFMIEAGNGQCPEWLMFRQDVQRSGYLSHQDIDQSCSEVLSVTPVASDNGVIVYPNPFTELFTVVTTGGYSLEVLDLSGRVIETHTSLSNTYAIDASYWQPGMYIVRVTSSEAVTTIKVLKQ